MGAGKHKLNAFLALNKFDVPMGWHFKIDVHMAWFLGLMFGMV